MAATVREFPPPADLRGLIEALWVRESVAANGEEGAGTAAQPVLPDGCMDLIFCSRRGDADGGAVLVSGPDTRTRLVRVEPDAFYAGVRFRPGLARTVLGLDPAALVDTTLWAASGPPALARAADRLHGRASAAIGAERLAAEVRELARATPHVLPPRRVRHAITLLRSPADHQPGVAEVARMLGVTPRTLHRDLLAWTGLPPRLLARIFRFRTALARLRAESLPLAALAIEAGYSDQPHMTREFRSLGRLSPAAFRHERPPTGA